MTKEMADRAFKERFESLLRNGNSECVKESGDPVRLKFARCLEIYKSVLPGSEPSIADLAVIYDRLDIPGGITIRDSGRTMTWNEFYELYRRKEDEQIT